MSRAARLLAGEVGRAAWGGWEDLECFFFVFRWGFGKGGLNNEKYVGLWCFVGFSQAFQPRVLEGFWLYDLQKGLFHGFSRGFSMGQELTENTQSFWDDTLAILGIDAATIPETSTKHVWINPPQSMLLFHPEQEKCLENPSWLETFQVSSEIKGGHHIPHKIHNIFAQHWLPYIFTFSLINLSFDELSTTSKLVLPGRRPGELTNAFEAPKIAEGASKWLTDQRAK